MLLNREERDKRLRTDGNDQYKYGKSHWFKYKGLTYIEAPLKW